MDDSNSPVVGAQVNDLEAEKGKEEQCQRKL
jgi:hypothetical protein